MSTPDSHLPDRRVAPPTPGDVRGWLGLVLDVLPVPALVIDTGSGRVVVRNPAAAHIPPADLGGPTDTERFLLRLAADSAGEQGSMHTWRVGERETHVRVFARLLPPADGKAPLVLLTFLDVSDQVEREREFRDALRARDDFFSVATHELKDPLFAIQLSLQLLRYATDKQGSVPPHLAYHLDVSGRQADRLARLIDNLLDVSRIRGGRLQLDPEALDLTELARDVASRFQESARAGNTPLAAELDGPVIGYFDRSKLDQVLSNLLTNALKYGAGRPVAVRAREAGEFAVVEVEDHGPGIDPADHGRIFARFERASNGHKKESLGLGLYIVRSIAEAHGGSVTVRSEPGRGATFTVTLPRYRLHHKEAAAGERGSGESA